MLMALAGAALGGPGAALAAAPGRAAPQEGRIVSEEPASNTPNILNGTVNSLAQVGEHIVVGGNFTEVQNPNSSAVIDRRGVFAFEAATGRISTAFDLGLNGTVYAVRPSADGTSVYVGGAFSRANGTTVDNLTKVDVASGDLVTAFDAPGLSGQVRDVAETDERLWVAGKFTHIGGRYQRALGTLNATTGRYDPYFTGVMSGTHNPNFSWSVPNVLQISASPDGSSLVAVGNFKQVNGEDRSQIAKFDIGGPTYALSAWKTNQFTQNCSRAFETYMSDVEHSPDGSFFVVGTTGAYGGSTGSYAGTAGCDVVARFEEGSTAPAARPTWTQYTGGDTIWTVEVTADVVYSGGHQRWQNNPGAGDRPGPGAVEREGIAALDAVTGLPLSWNPTRSRGVGVQDMLATEDGLYVGSDTTLIGPTPGNRYHARIALMPLSSGERLPSPAAYALPAEVATVATNESQLRRRTFDGAGVTSERGAAGSANRPDWGDSVGAFMVDGQLYVGDENGSVSKRSFDGSSYGAATPVDVADQLVYQSTWHNSDVRNLTSLFYSEGRMYFTRSGQNQLYSRAFSVESDIVGEQRFSLSSPPGVSYSSLRGAFVADGQFYFATTSGRLYRMGWGGIGTTTGPSGTPVQVSGPGIDTQNWASRVMFPQQGPPPPPNDLPTASIQVTCTALTCAFDGTDSSDPDGSIDSYDWDFGDGSAGSSEPSPTHTYDDEGSRTVTLTVEDDRGARGTATATVSPTVEASPVEFVDVAHTEGNRNQHRVTVPAGTRAGDRMLLYFGANTTRPTYTGPAGWTELETRTGTGIVGRVYTKVADDDDAGTTVTIASTSYAKGDVTLAVYRGVASGEPLSASLLQNSNSVEHRTPTLEVPAGGGWLVSFWTEKSSEATTWSVPAGQTERSAGGQTPASGHMISLLTDSAGMVPAGTHGDLAATADAAGRGITASVLLRAGSAPAPENQAPVAAAAVPVCTDLECSFDGSESSDPDGDDLTYDWDYGDTSPHGTEVSPTHTYGEAGSRTVTLTVTDPDGESDSVQVTAEPTDPVPGNQPPVAAAAVPVCTDLECSFDGSESSDPDGDDLTYDWDYGDTSPHGTEVSPTHTYGEAGSRTVTLTVTDPDGESDSVQVTAEPTDPVPGNQPPVAAAAVPVCTDLECSFDGSESSDPDGDDLTYDWDYGDTSPHGTEVSPTHTYGEAGSRTVTLTVTDPDGESDSVQVTAEPTDPVPGNQPPVAAAAVPVCTDLECSFDGSESSDPDGDDLTYDWDYGDTSPHGTEVSPTHTYGEAGSRTVTLTVTDPDGESDSVQVTAEPTDPATGAAEVTFVDAEATAGNRTRHPVDIPAGVQPGDRLVLFLTGNTTRPTYTGPDGWTEVVAEDGSGFVLRAWTRVATVDDVPGTSVAVTTTSYAKSNATLAAYRADSGTPALDAVEWDLDNGSGATHESPTVTVDGEDSWLLTYWADESGGTTTLDTPAEVQVRARATSGGGGHITSAFGDSDGPVPSGAAGGLTATADSTSSRGASISIVLRAP